MMSSSSDSLGKDAAAQAQEFFGAVRGGDLEAVATFLERSPELSKAHDPHSFGATALIHACGASNLDMVDLLLARGADIDQRSDWWAGSWGVLDSGSQELAKALIARGATLTAHAASRLGRIEDLRALLDADPSLVHAKGGDGKRPLHFAATAEVADLLLDRGAELEARDVDHLSTAAQWLISSHPEVARHLIERGAQADAVIAACLEDRDRLARLLGREEASAFRIDRRSFPTEEPAAGHIYLYAFGEGSSLLHLAASAGKAETLHWLLGLGLDPNLRGGYDDATPLHQAAWNDRPEAISALVEAGADIDRVSGEIHRNEPVGWAIVAGSANAVAMLLDRGCSLRDEHRADARAGAEGKFRNLQSGRPLSAWQEVAELIRRAPPRS